MPTRKTQLVTEFVFQYRDTRPESSVLWVTAASLDSIESDFGAIGQKLKTKLKTQEESSSGDNGAGLSNDESLATLTGPALVKAWLTDATDWVLVLDNLDDVSLDVRPFLPQKGCGAIIITSRDRRILGSLANLGMELPQMGFEESARLFLKLQRTDSSHEVQTLTANPEYSVMKDILEELHGFPLAIDQAAAFIRENSTSLLEYLEFLKPRTEDRELLLRFKQANPTYPGSIMTTWEISFRYIERTHPRASLILELLGFLHHSDISEALLKSATAQRRWEFPFLPSSDTLNSERLPEMSCLTGNADFRVAVGVLVAFSLARQRMNKLKVHPLVHEWIRLRLNTDRGRQIRLSIAAALTVYQSFPFELAIEKLCGTPLSLSEDSQTRIMRVSPHIKPIVLNLQEYSSDQSQVLDCISLLTGFVILTRGEVGSYRIISDHSTAKIHKLLRLLMQQTSEEKRPYLSLILAILKWKLDENNGQVWSKVAKYILTILQTPQIKFNSVSSSAMILLILVKLLGDFCRVGSAEKGDSDYLISLSIPYTLAIGGLHSTKITDKMDTISLVPQIINRFRQIVEFDTWDLAFNQAAQLYTDTRYACLLSADDFWQQPNGYLTKDLFSLNLEHLDVDDKRFFISTCCRLQWERKPFPDVAGVQNAYEFGILEAQNTAETLCRVQKSQSMHLSVPIRSYLSTSWGRNDSEFMGMGTARTGLDQIFSPYLRGTILNVIEAFSDPTTKWCGRSENPQLLKLEDRRYAIALFKLLRDRFFELESLNIMEFDDSYHRQMQSSLLRIFRNLEEWDNILRMIGDIIHFGKIEERYGNHRQKFWEPEPSAAAHNVVGFSEASVQLNLSKNFTVYGSFVRYTGALIDYVFGAKAAVTEDPWTAGITLRARQLSDESALRRRVLTTNSSFSEDSTKNPSSLDHVEESENIALYILGQYGMIDLRESLLSDFTDDVLDASIIASKMSDRVSDLQFGMLKTRLEFVRKQSSLLIKALGRLALIVDLARFPGPTSSIDINRNAIPQAHG
jgi:hypothetical protein